MVTLGFSGNNVNGKDGCNSYQGVFEQTNCRIGVDSLISTLMACSPDIMNQANAYMIILRQVESFRTKDNQLRLFTDDDQVLIFEKQ